VTIGERLSTDPALRLFLSTDVDDTRARIAAVMQPHRLQPVGHGSDLQARMSFLRMPGLGLGTIRFGEMALELDEVEDYHLLIFCISGQARFSTRDGDHYIGGSRGICLAPGDPVKARFSEDCEQLVVRIDAATMRRTSQSPDPALHSEIDLSRPGLRPWVGLVELMTNDAATLDLLRRDDRIGAHYAELFASALLDGQGRIEDKRRDRIAPAAVKRAEAYIDANFADPISLGDIAVAAGVPVRTLLHSFKRFRGVSPMRQLRDRRLDHAMAELRSADPSATVAQIASDAGFSHLGRFSQEYRARFGETPSSSLRRPSADEAQPH
jgi:AraC-like DNA-binding protein